MPPFPSQYFGLLWEVCLVWILVLRAGLLDSGQEVRDPRLEVIPISVSPESECNHRVTP